MNTAQFLHELLKRTKASAVNLRVTEYEHGAGLHLFMGESVFSFDCEVGDFDNLQKLIDDVDSYLDKREQQDAIAEVNKTVDELRQAGNV